MKNHKTPIKPNNPKKIDTQKILAWILCGLIIFWTVASVFAFIAYGKTTKKGNAIITASADTFDSVTYPKYTAYIPQLSSCVFYEDYVQEFIAIDRVGFSNANSKYDVAFIFGGNQINFTQLRYNDTINYNYDYIIADSFASPTQGNGICTIELLDDITGINFSKYIIKSCTVNLSLDNQFMKWLFDVEFAYLNNKEQVLNIEFALRTYSTLGEDTIYSTQLNDYYRDIDYTFQSVDTAYAYFLYKDYISIGSGYDEGYNSGYKKGNEVGYNNGYYEGLADGVENANEYSFVGLLSSVVDVPVKAFTSLFDFNFLGINLAQFFLSLLTLAVVIAVVRLII